MLWLIVVHGCIENKKPACTRKCTNKTPEMLEWNNIQGQPLLGVLMKIPCARGQARRRIIREKLWLQLQRMFGRKSMERGICSQETFNAIFVCCSSDKVTSACTTGVQALAESGSRHLN
jgi:hypothetical protein